MKVIILFSLAALCLIQMTLAAPAAEAVANPEAEPTFLLAGLLAGAAAAREGGYGRYGGYGGYRSYGGYGGYRGGYGGYRGGWGREGGYGWGR